ncbi:MAG: site-specific integrase [Candidatus Hydrogenedentes bacterium]|nr:site-specific integrase [Candidatus Hydrogenedentota bacterium]
MKGVKIRQRKRQGSTAVMLDYFDGKKRVQRVFGSASTDDGLAIVLEAAEREAAQIYADLLHGRYRPGVGDKPIDAILTEFLEYIEASPRAVSTRELYALHIGRFRKFLATTKAKWARDLTPDLVVDFIRSQKSSAPDTIRSSVSMLSTAFKRAVNRGDLQLNPCAHDDVKEIKPSTRAHERNFTDEEFEKLLRTARAWGIEEADLTADFFILLGETGLRLSEGLMLRWCDVNLDPDGSFLRVQARPGWTPKTKQSLRRVPLSPRVDAMLRRRLREAGMLNPSARIFPERWTRKSIERRFDRILKRAGMRERDEATGDKLRVHSLRHYFATTLVRAGVNAATVRDLCGHSSIEMTNRYFTMPNSEAFGAVAQAFDPRHKNVTNPIRFHSIPLVSDGNNVTSGNG